ncbi:MAG TPA: nuclear transport factor 2 family protein, partial [Sphingomonadaceae bacterium]|nr:nuclear transport factor 2 family protein [Sphingomonadaceae bacterium]
IAAQAEHHEPTAEERLQRLEAESDIRRMLVEYGAFLDGRNYAAYAGLFAADGVWTGGFGSFTGRDAIEQMLVDNLGAPEPGFVNKSSFHMMSNPLIFVEGDRAQVSSSYMFWTRNSANGPNPLLAGRYVDEFVKEAGEWKIARRTTYGQIPYRDPANPSANEVTGLPSLEARLQRAEDILAIQRVIVDYAAFIDAQDFEAYAALFAPDGIWQNGNTIRRGPDEIKAMLVGLFGTPPEGFVNKESYHLVSNPQIEVDGDRATARSRHLLVMRGADGSPIPELAGLYEDELIRVDGQWKILKRVDNPIMPTPEEWMREIRARNAAQ